MGIAISFLALLAIVTSLMGKVAPRWKLFPEPAPKKPAAKPATDDTAIAIAIAVANSRR